MAKRSRKEPEYFACPHCGAQVRVGAAACRQCGADAESGWGDHDDDWGAEADAGYADDDDFDYDEYLEREFPEYAPGKPRNRFQRAFFVAVIVLLVVAFALMALIP